MSLLYSPHFVLTSLPLDPQYRLSGSLLEQVEKVLGGAGDPTLYRELLLGAGDGD